MIEQTQREAQPSTLAANYRAVLSIIIGSQAARLFCGVYLLATLLLIVTGHAGFLLLNLYTLVFFLLTLLIVLPLTASRLTPAWEDPSSYSRGRLWLQIGVALLVAALFSISGLLPPTTALSGDYYWGSFSRGTPLAQRQQVGAWSWAWVSYVASYWSVVGNSTFDSDCGCSCQR